MKCYLKDIRKKKKIKQKDLAEFFKLSQTTISEWEKNNNVPNLRIAYEIANFLDVEVTDIWK